MSATFRPIPEFDLSKMSFAVTAPKGAVLPASMPVSKTTTYTQFGAMGYPTAKELDGDTFGSYVYSHFVDSQGGPQFYFVKPRDATEQATAITALTIYERDSHPWPAVINWICAVEIKDRPLQFEVQGRRVEVPSLELRMSKIEGGSFVSQLKTEYFVSHTPFPETFFRANPPIPGVIEATVRNIHVNEYALHPQLKLPALNQEGVIFPEFGYFPSNLSFSQPQILPATNYVRWVKHVARERVTQQGGLYICERLTVKPPKGIANLIIAA